MKAGWEEVRLDDLCVIARGGSPRPIKAYVTDAPDGINWIKIGDTQLGGRYIDTTKEKIKPSGIARSRYVEAGSFLLSNSMSFGRPYILRTNGCIHDGWLVLEPDYSRVDQEFLYYALSSRLVFDQFNSLAAGATVRNLNIDLVSKVVAPIPPLEEQKRIVAVLDAAFEGLTRAKENAEANLQNARELFESTLSFLFNQSEEWEATALNDHVAFMDYRGKTPPKREAGVRLITAKNVKRGFIQEEPMEFIDADAYEGWMTRGFPEDGDVLFTTEAPLANVAQLDTSENVVIGQRLITMKPDRTLIDREFLKFALMSPQMQEEIFSYATGATVLGIKAKLLKTVSFRFPKNLADQRKVAVLCRTSFEKMDQLAEVYRAKLADIADLRQSLLQKAFAGELT